MAPPEETETTQTAEEGGEGERTEEERTEESGEEQSGSKAEEKKDDDFPWDEHNRLKREAAERASKDKEAERKRKAEEGKWREVAEEAQKGEKEARDELAQLKRDQRVAKVADEVGLKHPDDAPRYLTEDEMSDDRSARRALEKLRESREELFKEQRRSGGEVVEEEEETDDTAGSGEEEFGFGRLMKVKRKND